MTLMNLILDLGISKILRTALAGMKVSTSAQIVWASWLPAQVFAVCSRAMNSRQ